MLKKIMYQEELEKIYATLDTIRDLSDEKDEDAKAGALLNSSFKAVGSLIKIISIAKAAGMAEAPDMHNTKSGFVYDLEALGHKILVKAGAFWRSTDRDLDAVINFLSNDAATITNDLIDSITDTKAATLKHCPEAVGTNE